jgi:hypothetical protein
VKLSPQEAQETLRKMCFADAAEEWLFSKLTGQICGAFNVLAVKCFPKTGPCNDTQDESKINRNCLPWYHHQNRRLSLELAVEG